MTRMPTTKMPVFLPLALFYLAFPPSTLFFLVFLSPMLFFWFSYLRRSPHWCLYSWCYLFWSFYPLCHPLGLLNHSFSSFLFYSSPVFCFFSCFYLFLFSFIHSTGSNSIFYQDIDAYSSHAISLFSFPMQVFRTTSLLLNKNYIVKYSLSLLKTFRK